MSHKGITLGSSGLLTTMIAHCSQKNHYCRKGSGGSDYIKTPHRDVMRTGENTIERERAAIMISKNGEN